MEMYEIELLRLKYNTRNVAILCFNSKVPGGIAKMLSNSSLVSLKILSQ